MGRVAALITTLGSVVFLASVCCAESAPERLDSSVIEQIVVASFKPEKLILLRENGLGEVEQLAGTYIERPQDDPNKPAQFFAGVRVPHAKLPSGANKIFFSFFLAGKDANFAATPVTSWSLEQLRQNSQSIAALTDEVSEMDEEFKLKQADLETLDTKLDTLRDRASQIAGVDDIIDLKMKLTQLKGFGEDSKAEIERLRTLVDSGRNLPEPEGSKVRVQELSLQLKETARVTAMADRLNARRREAARSSLNKKVALVQEMRGVDATALAREVLKVRAERKQLEQRLGSGSTPDSEL